MLKAGLKPFTRAYLSRRLNSTKPPIPPQVRRNVWKATSVHTSAAVLFVSGLFVYGLTKGVYADANQFPLRDEAIKQRISKPLSRAKPVEHFDQNSVDVDAVLREREESHRPEKGTGVSRYDIAQVSSNAPSEDDHSEAIIPLPFGHWSFFTIFDGHSGWETSAWLRENMILALLSSLSDLYSRFGPKHRPSAEDIDGQIKETFKDLDHDIIHERVEQVFRTESNSRHASINLLAPAWAGSCAILGFYDSETNLLRVALTGDLRAVLGRKSPDGQTYEVKVLSADQNGENPEEKARMEAEHPGEVVVKGSRCMGYGMARAFGDARMKWSREIQDRLKREYLGRTPPSNLQTPPYFTAEPVITTTEIQPGDFLIMASDGLWECLSNEEAVGLVGLWIAQSLAYNSDAVFESASLPVLRGTDSSKECGDARHQQWGIHEKKFTNVDRNAATHLIRNALGGADGDVMSALLSMRSPRQRSYMDDITATVVFFADAPNAKMV